MVTAKNESREDRSLVQGTAPQFPPRGTARFMEKLLRLRRAGRLSASDWQRLLGEHLLHFKARARKLPALLLPGGEKDSDSVEGAGNEAFVFFDKVERPRFNGKTAFTDVIDRLQNCVGYLYYWRGSALFVYLRWAGGSEINERFKFITSVRKCLRRGEGTTFRELRRPDRENLWALSEWGDEAWTKRRPDRLGALQFEVNGARGQGLVRRVLEAADQPLTKSEIVSALLARLGFSSGRADTRVEPVVEPEPLGAEEVEARVREFYQALSPEERELLLARGWAAHGKGTVPFRQVAKKLGRLGPGSYSNMERTVLDIFRERFDEPGEQEVASAALLRVLQEDARSRL